MDIETSNRYGNKRVHHRLGPSQPAAATANKVCYNWRAGRCTRHPCAFLHSELPETAAGPKRAQYQPPGGGDDRGPPHRRPGVHTWRNPNAAKWGGPRPPQKPSDKICRFFHSGKCTFGEKCRNLHAWFVSDSFSLVTLLEGHQKVITGITLPSGSDKLYSASKDESVRIWDCQSGQCAGVINLGCEVGCMISEGPWIFVGIPSAVKAWNTQTSTELSLSGPTGQVYALVVGNEMLFAGVQDGRILAWKFSAVGNHFELAALLVEHQLAVVTLVVGAMKLYSGSMDATIKVWDLTTLQCLQTLTDHTNVVMSVLCWSQFLLSCSLDQTIKVWAATESGSLEVTYTHNEEHGVLALWGTLDAQAKPVLLCSCNDNTVRLYDLPSFGERGKIFSKEEVRAIQAGPGGIFFTGDGTGQLKVWKWLVNEPPQAAALS